MELQRPKKPKQYVQITEHKTQVLTLHLQYAMKEMTERLSHDTALTDAIIPKNFGVGCRRPTVSINRFSSSMSTLG